MITSKMQSTEKEQFSLIDYLNKLRLRIYNGIYIKGCNTSVFLRTDFLLLSFNFKVSIVNINDLNKNGDTVKDCVVLNRFDSSSFTSSNYWYYRFYII